VRRFTYSCCALVSNAESILAVGDKSGELIVAEFGKDVVLNFELLGQDRGDHPQIHVGPLLAHTFNHIMVCRERLSVAPGYLPVEITPLAYLGPQSRQKRSTDHGR
jgi:hypothetical protein